MKKIYLLIPMLLWAVLCSYAQQSAGTEIVWGPEDKEPWRSEVTQVIGANDAGFYALRKVGSGKPKPVIEYYDKEMQLLDIAEPSLRYKGKRHKFEGVVYMGGQLHVLSSRYQRKERAQILYAETFNTLDLTSSGEAKELTRIYTDFKLDQGWFEYELSEKSTKLLIYQTADNEPYISGKMTLTVFDSWLTLQWQRDLDLNYERDQFELMEYLVDEAGNAFVLGRSCRGYYSRVADYEYIVVSFTELGEQANSYLIHQEDKLISDLRLLKTKEGKLACSGFYGDKIIKNKIGTCYYEIDTDNQEISLEEFSEIHSKDVQEMVSNNRGVGYLGDFILKDVFANRQGEIIMIAEEEYEYIQNIPVFVDVINYSMMYYNRTIKNHHNLIVFKLTQKGQLDWTNVIPKYQRKGNKKSIYSSYALSQQGDNLMLLYNEHRLNVSQSNTSRLRNYQPRTAVATGLIIKPDGSYSKQVLYKNKEHKVTARPIVCKQISDDEWILFGDQGRKYKFGMIRFGDTSLSMK